MGWGTTLIGFGSTIDVLESISMEMDGDALYIAGPTVSYAVHQEMGTRSQPARPFMRPAAERVKADPAAHARRMVGSISSEEELIRGVALAVQNEGKKIADAKDVRDTGALIASISIQRVK